MGYFIHNKYDKDSIAKLATIDTSANTVIDFYGLLESGDATYKYLDTSQMGVSVIDSLTYIPVDLLSSQEGSSNDKHSALEFESSHIIKSIQRVTASSTTAITIAPVNPEKCQVFAFPTSSSYGLYGVELTPTTVRALRAASTGVPAYIEIVEYR